MGGAISAGVADECNRTLGQELTPVEEEIRADLVNAGKQRELAAWAKFDAFSPHEASRVQKQIVETRWVLTWETLGGKECVEARLVAKGYQDPDLKDG